MPFLSRPANCRRRTFLGVLVLLASSALLTGGCRREKAAAPRTPPAPPAAKETAEQALSIPFKNVAEAWGVQFDHFSGQLGEKLLPETGGGGVALFDYDGDGDLDILLTRGSRWPWAEKGNEEEEQPPILSLGLFRNDGEAFTDVSDAAGLNQSFYAQGVAVGDYDADGDDDLYVTGIGQSILLENVNGVFHDATPTSGIAAHENDWLTSAGFFDYDRDGDLDLFVCNYVVWTRDLDVAAPYRLAGIGRSFAPPFNFAGTHNVLYRNDGGTFTDVSETAGVQVSPPSGEGAEGKALAVVFVDFDQDGWIDIFVANDTVRNFLYHNNQDGSFEEMGELAGIAFDANGGATSGMGVDVAWFRNNDDLAIAVGNFSNEMTSFFVSKNHQEIFTDEAMSTGIGGPTRERLSFGLLFDDYDQDGRVDLMQANGHLEENIGMVQANQEYRQPAQLFWNADQSAELEFKELAADAIGDLATPIVGRAAASGDLDGDGDLDLVLTQVDGPPLVLRNEQQSGHHYLRCRLEGPSGNPHSIGAVVSVEVGGQVLRRVVSPTRSYLSQCDPTATFGLGDNTMVDRVVVTWPDGAQQVAQPDAVDQTLVIKLDAPSYASLLSQAKAYFEQADYPEAAGLCRKAIAIRPGDLVASRNLARCLLLSGNVQEAEQVLEAIDKQDASAAHAYLRGLIALRDSRFSEAATQFALAVDRKPGIATVHYQLAKALQAAGDKDLAREQFAKAAELDPIHGGAQYQLATLARAAGELDTYREFYRDFQRIRAIKGELATDASILEACSLTEIELPSAAASSSGTPPKFAAPASLSEQPYSDIAVLDIDAQGAYVYVAANPSGRVECGTIRDGKFNTMGPGIELAGYESGERLRVIVGNAIVDPSTDGPSADLSEVLVSSPSKCWLLRMDASGEGEDLTDSAGLGQAKGAGAIFVDYDHDGALDILTYGDNALTAYRNRGDRQFTEATEAAGLAGIQDCRQVSAQDFQTDNLGIDLAAVVDGNAVGYDNAFRGRFRPMDRSTAWGAASHLACDDFDGDAVADVAVFSGKTVRILLSGTDAPVEVETDLDQVDAGATIDYDNDGLLDLAVAGHGQERPALMVLQNSGHGFAPTRLPPPPARVATLLDVDADADADTDLLATSQDGKIWLFENATSPVGKQLKLSLHSFTGQPSSIGVRVQARHGGTAVTRFTHRQLPIEIGLGKASEAETVQTLWGNGVVHNELDVAVGRKPVDIQILEFIRTSSCPFLYALHDGDWRFETDVLGASPLNVAWERGVPVPADSDEVIKLSAPLSEPATVRFTSELREATYLDETVLIDVAHAEDVEVFSTDHTGPNPAEGKGLVAGRNPQKIVSATREGHNVTEALSSIDDKVVLAGQPLSPPAVGHTQPGSLTFRFPASTTSAPRLLALTGWFRFGSSSTNIASAERQDVAVQWPKLEARVGDRWVLVSDAIGIPTGNTKTIVCRLPNEIPSATTEFRLSTSLEVRWDAIELYEEVPGEELVVTTRPPMDSEVSWHGFPLLATPSPDLPQTPALDSIRARPPWNTTLAGWCTRYGDATPLLKSSDQQMVILNSGDGVTIRFAPAEQAASELPAHTHLMYVRGWIKEWDPNAEPPQRVAPFPGSNGRVDDAEQDWQLEYNTRWVPSAGGWSEREE